MTITQEGVRNFLSETAAWATRRAGLRGGAGGFDVPVERRDDGHAADDYADELFASTSVWGEYLMGWWEVWKSGKI